MIKKEDITAVGKFQKTHALKGELNMISDIDPQYFLDGNPLIIEDDGILVPFFVESVRPKGSTSYLVKISGINSEEDASSFVNKEVNMLRKDADDWIDLSLPEEYEYMYYYVVDTSTGKSIGRIIDVEDSTTNILFIVEKFDGDEILIPATEDFIKEIDEDNNLIKMDIPEGLLDINNKD